ncbi:MAG TPA: MBL fold metallo-hydrolase [Kofleriaceae bacterium]|nr:MBL fold metallo-hydrolase [Kofleriaceae bacterium]
MADSQDQRVQELARRNSQRYTFRYRSLVLHWLGRTFRRPSSVDVAHLPPVDAGQVSITWGGHATALVRYQRLSAVCDPVLARSVSGVPRELSPGLNLESLADVDLVLISSGAADHLDLPTLSRLSRGATVVVPPRTAARVSPLGFARLVELSPGCTLEHRGLEVWAEQVRHGRRGSPAVSYVLRGDGPTVYFCGASGYHAGFADIGRRHWPDVALLPIAGYWPRSFRSRHMSPVDALYAFEDLRARVMVPIGYGTFAMSYERMNDPERWLAELVAERHLERFVVRLITGETRVFVPPGGASGVDSNRFEVDSDGLTAATSQAALMARAHAAQAAAARKGVPTNRPAMPIPAPPEGQGSVQAGSMSSPGSKSSPATSSHLPAPRSSPSSPDLGRLTAAGVAPAAPSPGAMAQRRRPALIVDIEDQDDETSVFDQPSGLRTRNPPPGAPAGGGGGGAGAGAGDDDEDVDFEDDARTRALVLELPVSESEPVPVPLPLPGSR